MTEFTPDYVSPPGDTLAETLQAIGMTAAELALRCGYPVLFINEIVRGETEINHATAVKFESILGVPTSFWLNRERKYREARQRLVDSVAEVDSSGEVIRPKG
jgi:plasmid maintenance system antidote protein VapI